MPTRNPLHQYVNWTYNLSLYALSKDEYNANICYGPTVNPGGSLLIASGGIQEGRHAAFKEDFYFDRLKINSPASLTVKDRNSQSSTLEFTIIEPMGVTLFNRLIEVADERGFKKISEMPYVLKIKWKGYNIDGSPAKIDIVKVYPIQLNSVNMKINQRGAQYDIVASPYNSSALGDAVAGNPVRIESSAPTVGEAFLSNIVADPPKTSDLLTQVPASDVHVRSYTGALNKWYKQQALDKHATNTDSIVFEIHPDIANAKLVETKEVTVQEIYMPKPGTPEAIQNCATSNTRPKAALNSNMSFSQGTAIHELLSTVIRESTYITDQVKDEQKGQGDPGRGMVKWFKVLTRVDIGEWEPAFNRNVRKYIYRVVPYETENTKNRSFPMTTLENLPPVVKEYNYIFTGKNDDVISLDLQFNALWFNTVTTNQENAPALSGGQESTPTLSPDPEGATAAQAAAMASEVASGKAQFASAIFPTATTTTSLRVGSGSKGEKSKEIQQQLLSKPGGDMQTVQLKIVGDPDFLKQDEFLYWNARGDTTPNGSITTDVKGVYISILAKTATDYNDQGLAIPGTGKYTMCAFAGIYQVTTLESEFAQGKFTQTLQCSRFSSQAPQK